MEVESSRSGYFETELEAESWGKIPPTEMESTGAPGLVWLRRPIVNRIGMVIETNPFSPFWEVTGHSTRRLLPSVD